MYRFHPQWLTAKSWVEKGRIGELRTIQSFFSYFNMDPENIRNKADIGGGGLMDIGCYPVSLSRFIFGEEPSHVLGRLDIDPRFQTDRMVSVLLQFETGTSLFTCSTQIVNYQRVHIFGTKGRIEIQIPFNAPNDRPCKIFLQTHSGIKEISVEICDQYTLQGDQFSLCILNGTDVPTPLTDAVCNMRVLEAVRKSARTQSAVEIE
ncbi:Gfo/Idh/MocA family oxidoreductase [bacterium]|nr:Gfo/Idh/MocA family oxidoreductase [bacterium]